MNTEGIFGRLSAYGFYDIGAAWKQDVPGRESAATAGHRVSRSQGSSLTGYLEVAAPLTGPGHRRQTGRLGVRRAQLPLLTSCTVFVRTRAWESSHRTRYNIAPP